MSRRQIAGKREAPLQSLRADRHTKHVILDSSLLTESRRGVVPDCGHGETLHGWTRDGVQTQAAKQTSQSNNALGPEFVVANRVFARVVLRHIRPFNHAAADREEQSCSFCEVKAARMSGSSPDALSPIRRQSQRPLTIGQSVASEFLLSPIETLFTELARRRLRSLVAKEKP